MLHELSHMWFNDDLFSDRWVNEGFAEEYATPHSGAAGRAAQAPRAGGSRRPGVLKLNRWSTPSLQERDQRRAGGVRLQRVVVRRCGRSRPRSARRAWRRSSRPRPTQTVSYVGDPDAGEVRGARPTGSGSSTCSTRWAARPRPTACSRPTSWPTQSRRCSRIGPTLGPSTRPSWTPGAGVDPAVGGPDGDGPVALRRRPDADHDGHRASSTSAMPSPTTVEPARARGAGGARAVVRERKRRPRCRRDGGRRRRLRRRRAGRGARGADEADQRIWANIGLQGSDVDGELGDAAAEFTGATRPRPRRPPRRSRSSSTGPMRTARSASASAPSRCCRHRRRRHRPAASPPASQAPTNAVLPAEMPAGQPIVPPEAEGEPDGPPAGD